MNSEAAPSVRLAELMASLSLAIDLGMGQPLEQTLNTCFLSLKAGRSLGVDAQPLSDIYYLALLRFIGCTSDAHEAAEEVGGDEIAWRANVATVLMGQTPEVLGQMLRHFGEGTPALKRIRLLLAAMLEGERGARRTIAIHCEIAQMLAGRLGINRRVADDAGHTFERWDGRGIPGELAGEAIPLPARIVSVARDVDLFDRLGGWAYAAQLLRKRRGNAYDPTVAGAFLQDGAAWLAELRSSSAWDAVLEAEPAPVRELDSMQLDSCLSAFADFVDLKSPLTVGHSPGVAALASEAARAAGLSETGASTVRLAGLVHDLGKVATPNGIWEKPGPLSPGEWERVRLHPYLTERVLSYSPTLRDVAAVAGAHHERLDGSGYHRGAGGGAISTEARLLAAADAYQAMGQPRPYRPALDAAARRQELMREADAGRLDPSCVRAVLEAAGQRAPQPRYAWPDGLTDREVEVLRLIVRGLPNRIVADRLVISPKTVGRHIENIYGKTGVSSRAAAALYAIQNNLL